MFSVQEPAIKRGTTRVNPMQRKNLRRLSRDYWWVVGIGGAFTLARFSEAFLVLRAHEGGLAIALTPLVLVGMNAVYAVTAYPFGKLSDAMSRARLLAWGLAVLIVADVVLSYSNHWAWVSAGIVLWGLHMGMTQGLLATMVADTAPEDLRESAYGFFNLVSAIALLVASTVAGLVWDRLGASYTFIAGILFCVAALIMIGVGQYHGPRTTLR